MYSILYSIVYSMGKPIYKYKTRQKIWYAGTTSLTYADQQDALYFQPLVDMVIKKIYVSLALTGLFTTPFINMFAIEFKKYDTLSQQLNDSTNIGWEILDLAEQGLGSGSGGGAAIVLSDLDFVGLAIMDNTVAGCVKEKLWETGMQALGGQLYEITLTHFGVNAATAGGILDVNVIIEGEVY